MRTRRISYVPELDSIRGMAMVTVFLAHLWIIWPTWTFTDQFAHGGFVGVDLFFVLSGFLITGLLLDEEARTGTIRLGRFYGRRALRLLPALWFGLLAYAVYARAADYPPFHNSSLTFGDLRAALVFGMNWHALWHPLTADLSPLWSLSIEAQFYVAWPLVVVGLLALRRSHRVIAGVGIALLVAVTYRRLQLFEHSGWEAAYLRSDSHVDGLLVGSVLACAWVRGWTPDRLPRWALWVAWAAAGGIFLVIRANERFAYAGGTTLFLAASAVIVLVAVTTARKELGPLGRITALVGRLSYGIYLWHFPVFWAAERWGRGWSNQERFASALAVIVVGATVSRIAVEQPALSFKRDRPSAAAWAPPTFAGPGAGPRPPSPG